MLFDLDGVLVDSIEIWHSAFNETLSKFDRGRVDIEKFRQEYWGSDLWTNLSKHGLGENAVKYCSARYFSNLPKVKLTPGAREVIDSIKSKAKLGLVTNTPTEVVTELLKRLGLAKDFDVVIAGGTNRLKPDPRGVIKACESLGVKTTDVVMVGDTQSDVQAGKSAGCIVVGLNTDADFTIHRLKELLDLMVKHQFDL